MIDIAALEPFLDHDLLLLDGFDDCFVGVVERFGGVFAACYDYDQIIATLMQDMDYDAAVEFFAFNIAGAYVGEATPVFLHRPS